MNNRLIENDIVKQLSKEIINEIRKLNSDETIAISPEMNLGIETPFDYAE